MRILVVVVALTGSVNLASAQRWQDATADCLGTTAQWTNKVEVADVDGDGQVDILLANGGNYSTAGTPEATRVFKNTGGWGAAGSHCTEITSEVFGGFTGLSRVIKAADLDGDGDLDLITGGGHQTQLKLFVRGTSTWSDASAQLPQQLTSIGDVEVGDVDRDGDLDLLLGEWGAGNALSNAGGRTRLYLNNGAGTFSEATATHMPDVLVKMSWDVELVDIDNDWDLDALISCKQCTRNFVFRNDGSGHFTDDPSALPAPIENPANNYEYEAMDIDGDGDLDLATINDGGNIKDTLLLNDGSGKFTDASSRLGSNPSADDNIAVWLDVDSDGDADLLIGTLGNDPDRLLLNDGAGNFTLAANATPNTTRGTLGLAAADLDGDGRLDLVQGQGEFPGFEDDKIQLATSANAIDAAAPVVRFEVIDGVVFARVHDHQSPSRAHDWQRVVVETPSGDVAMRWYGEYLWTAAATAVTRVCAVDRAGNEGCVDMPSQGDGMPGGDAGLPPIDEASGCCDSRTQPSHALLPICLALLIFRRRKIAE